MATLEVAAQIVAELTAAGIYATTSPAELVGNLPGVLVAPPALTLSRYAGPDATWRLVAVASTTTADPVAAWSQLDALLDVAWDALPLEGAEPSSYVLPDGTTAHPAYVLTLTTTGS